MCPPVSSVQRISVPLRTKMPDLGFGTSYKDGLCPKLKKNPAKPKLGTKNVLYDTSCPFLRSSKVLEFAIFG